MKISQPQKETLQKVDTLLIDLDGTLVDMGGLFVSIDFFRHALAHLKAQLGLKKGLKVLYRVHREMTRKETPLAIAGFTNDQKVIRALAKAADINEDTARSLLDELLRSVFPRLERHFKPVPGAQDFIQWAKPRYKLILATNPVWPVDVIIQRVQWAGINSSDFVFISNAANMHHIKPDRRYYEEILKLNQLNPEQCLHIGNEIEMDFPATDAGIAVFILSSRPRLRKLIRKKQKSPGFRGGFKGLKKLLETVTGK